MHLSKFSGQPVTFCCTETYCTVGLPVIWTGNPYPFVPWILQHVLASMSLFQSRGLPVDSHRRTQTKTEQSIIFLLMCPSFTRFPRTENMFWDSTSYFSYKAYEQRCFHSPSIVKQRDNAFNLLTTLRCPSQLMLKKHKLWILLLFIIIIITIITFVKSLSHQ